MTDKYILFAYSKYFCEFSMCTRMLLLIFAINIDNNCVFHYVAKRWVVGWILLHFQ